MLFNQKDVFSKSKNKNIKVPIFTEKNKKMGHKPVSKETIHQIIGLIKDQNKSNSEIANLVGVSEKCVWTTRTNYNEKNIIGESSKPGRPTKLTERDRNALYRMFRAKKYPSKSYRRLATEFNSMTGMCSTSAQRVGRVLKKKGIKAHWAARNPC